MNQDMTVYDLKTLAHSSQKAGLNGPPNAAVGDSELDETKTEAGPLLLLAIPNLMDKKIEGAIAAVGDRELDETRRPRVAHSSRFLA